MSAAEAREAEEAARIVKYVDLDRMDEVYDRVRDWCGARRGAAGGRPAVGWGWVACELGERLWRRGARQLHSTAVARSCSRRGPALARGVEGLRAPALHPQPASGPECNHRQETGKKKFK